MIKTIKKKTFYKSIIITPTLFKVTFQDLIILRREFSVVSLTKASKVFGEFAFNVII